MKKFIRSKAKLIVKVLVVVLVTAFIGPVTKIEAVGNFTLSKDTLSNSRPSVSTTLGTAVASGNTSINLASTTGIYPGDVLTFAQGTPENLTVATITDSTHIATTTAAANAHTISSAVYDKQTSTHTFTFTTRSAVASGSFLITFPGTPATGDGIPDSGQFDFNSLVLGDVSASGFTPGTIVVTSSAATVSVPFSSSIAASTAITITVGSTNKLLNPTKTAASGTADIWAVRVDEKDAIGTIDTSSVDVGTIESAVVSVTVAPSLSFSIAAVASGQTAFGATNTNVTTTAVSVPFGSISPATAQYAAQDLTVSTNAVSGYTITSYQDGALRKTNGTAITTFSTTAADNNSNDGFGYATRDISGTDGQVAYNTSGTFYSKGFGTSGSPTTVMSNAGPVSASQSRIIYRVRVPATQAPGDYQNVVTYIASPVY
jgi:hypothetical protein